VSNKERILLSVLQRYEHFLRLRVLAGIFKAFGSGRQVCATQQKEQALGLPRNHFGPRLSLHPMALCSEHFPQACRYLRPRRRAITRHLPHRRRTPVRRASRRTTRYAAEEQAEPRIVRPWLRPPRKGGNCSGHPTHFQQAWRDHRPAKCVIARCIATGSLRRAQAQPPHRLASSLRTRCGRGATPGAHRGALAVRAPALTVGLSQFGRAPSMQNLMPGGGTPSSGLTPAFQMGSAIDAACLAGAFRKRGVGQRQYARSHLDARQPRTHKVRPSEGQ